MRCEQVGWIPKKDIDGETRWFPIYTYGVSIIDQNAPDANCLVKSVVPVVYYLGDVSEKEVNRLIHQLEVN